MAEARLRRGRARTDLTLARRSRARSSTGTPRRRPPFPAPTRRALRRALLAHYDAHRRVMPWRGAADPYGIWLSEVMLQQTRVETVRDRWPAFLREVPDVAALAACPDDRLMKAWEGLGYYARARNLKRAAKEVVASHGGRLPARLDDLAALPGFGPYTAAAVASIAFALPHAVLDGNVVRVLARLLDDRRDVTRAPVRRALQEAAQDLLDPARPGDWNQAVMDLGATVCVPRRPRCPECPVAAHCRAARAGSAPSLPRKPRPRAVPHVEVAVGLVRRRGALLVGRRPARGLLGGLWEFPGGKREPGETLEAACVREVAEETGLAVAVDGPAIVVKHAYSHFRVTIHAFPCRVLSGRLRARGTEDLRFVPRPELDALAFPRANRRILEALAAAGATPGAPAVRRGPARVAG